MAKKGSKYKRKHTVEESEKRSEEAEEREIAEKPYLAVIYHDEYLHDFFRLSYEDAGRAYEMLSKLSNDTSKSKISRIATEKLNEILDRCGLQISQYDGNFIHKQEVLTIRMDFYGTIDRLKAGLRTRELSRYYRSLMENPLQKRPKTAEYDFDSAPSWKLFSRFQSFRRIEKNLRAYLIKRKIDPQILQLMTPRDFSDLVVQAFQRSPDEQKVTFQREISVRNEFVRDLARRQGGEMAKMLLRQGHDERYVRSMINMMQRFGKYTSSKLIITEIHFTERVLADLKKAEANLRKNADPASRHLLNNIAQVNAQKFKVGDPIPQKLIDCLIDEKHGYLLVARDAKGKELQGAHFPSFEVHHKHAVSDAGDLKSVSYVNYKDNLCLVVSELHTPFIHRCDKIRQSGETKSYSKRLEFIDPNTAFMIGFKKEERLSYDFKRTKQSKRQIMDDRHIVSYNECMRQLALKQAAYDNEHHHPVFDSEQEVERFKRRKLKRKRQVVLKKEYTR